MSKEYQTVLWVILGIIIALVMISCSYSINVVQTKGVSQDAIDKEENQQLTLPVQL